MSIFYDFHVVCSMYGTTVNETMLRVNVSLNIAIVFYKPSQYYLFGAILLSFQLVRDILIW